MVTKISMAAPAGSARPRSIEKDTTPAVRACLPEQRRRQRTSTFAPLVAETLRLLTMMPVPVGVAVSFGVATSSGGQPPCAAHAGLVGAVVERVEDVVVVAVGEELEAQPEDAAGRDPRRRRGRRPGSCSAGRPRCAGR